VREVTQVSKKKTSSRENKFTNKKDPWKRVSMQSDFITRKTSKELHSPQVNQSFVF
jgi:hypothetical protein